MTGRTSLTPDYFERMFAGDPDPWNFETSAYEAAKFAASIAALPQRSYRRALDVGCANGVLTQQLAPRCASLLALDVSETALVRARRRNADLPQVEFTAMTFPRDTPDGRFDLVVMSEVVYYWSSADIAAAAAWLATHLERGGDLLLVHWIGDTDYPQTGDEAVRRLRAALPNVEALRADRTDKYRLDLWRMA